MLPTTPAPGSTEGVSLMPLLTPSPVKAKGKYKILPKDLDLSKIPTFIPQIKRGAEELVWSPTLGTRPRRSGETYQQSIDALAADPLPFGPGDPSVHSVAYDSANQYHFRDDRDPSDSSWKGHRHSDFIRTTPPQLKSTLSPLNPSLASSSRSKRNHNRTRDRRNNLEDAPFPNDVDRMMEMATLRHNPNSRHSASSHYDTTGYPVQDLSRPTSPSHFRGPRYPSNQVRDIHTSTRFSAPRSAPSYGNVNQTGQGMYGGYPTPYQDQLGPFRPAPSPATSNPFAARTPDPQIWSSNRSSQSISGALPRQMPNQMIQPVHHMTAQAQMPSDMARSSENELSIPPQGLMDPLSYWNMLHQRELEIRTRLRNANRPMTAQEHHYIFLLGEARISAVATQLPDRNGRHARDWLRELGRTLESIWKPGPGAMGFTPLVVARKQDFEKAVEREIEMTKRENWHRQSHSGSSAAYEDFTRR